MNDEDAFRTPSYGPNGKLMQSHVWHKGTCYFVSTIDRDSSAMVVQARYAETLVWECDPITGQRGNTLLDQGDAGEGSIRVHLMICHKLHDGGIEALQREYEESSSLQNASNEGGK